MADYKDYYDQGAADKARNHIQSKWTPGIAPTSTSEPHIPTPTTTNIPFPSVPWGHQQVPFYPLYPQVPSGATGWLCPACGRGNAPYVSQCACQGQQGDSYTTNKVQVYGQDPQERPPFKCARCERTGDLRSVSVILANEDTEHVFDVDLCGACYEWIRSDWAKKHEPEVGPEKLIKETQEKFDKHAPTRRTLLGDTQVGPANDCV